MIVSLELRKIVGLAEAVIDETGSGPDEHCKRDLQLNGDDYSRKMTELIHGLACVLADDQELTRRFFGYVEALQADRQSAMNPIQQRTEPKS